VKYLILENIRSAYNVGAIFRTADGAGVSKIFLIGYTPAPVDRFGRTQPEIDKTSLGAIKTVEWEYAAETTTVLERLKQEGCVIVAVEQTKGSIPLRAFVKPEKVAYIVGNEIDGVSAAATQYADRTVEIPMLGTKESLNVSVAAGIVLYHDLV
jgi:tRNA G18 (ribose-2'-O)-methylase SpoU